MGAASSSNIASAVTNVVNQVSNSTVANSSQVQNISDTITLHNCFIKTKNFNATATGTAIQKSSQIATALQNTHVKNDLQQKLLQTATSAVGSLGIGYSDANNSAFMMANSSTDISNQMSTSSNQLANVSNRFTCDNSTIIADNVNIDLSSTANFLSDEVLQNQQVADIVNKVSQTATQEASATVSGITGALIAMAILIIAIGWAFAKSVKAVGDNEQTKPFMMIGALVLFIGIFVYMWLNDCSPLFGKPHQCIQDNTLTVGDCINLEPSSIPMKSTPLRYLYTLTPAYLPTSIPDVNLLQMIISISAGESPINGGYNGANYNRLKSKIDNYNQTYKSSVPYFLKPDTVPVPSAFYSGGSAGQGDVTTNCCSPGAFIKNIPGGQPITFSTANCPERGTLAQGTTPSDPNYVLANINDDEINNWLETSGKSDQAKLLRFILCDLTNLIPLNIYIDDDELVKYKDKDGNTQIRIASDPDAQLYCYKFIPNIPYNFKSSLLQGGSLMGKVGVINDKTYQMYKNRKWIFIGFGGLILVFLIILIFNYLKKSKPPSTTS